MTTRGFSDALAEKLKKDGIQAEIFSYIRKQSFFETVVSYLINWKLQTRVSSVQKWISDNLELPQDLKDQLDKWNKDKEADKVSKVLYFINSKITYTPDSKQWAMQEKWSTPIETWTTKKGDCEDGALLMYACLRYLDVPDYKLYIIAGDVVGGGHCYLTYITDTNIEFPVDWCYWYSESIRFKIPYSTREDYYYGEKEWFRFNASGSFKRYETP